MEKGMTGVPPTLVSAPRLAAECAAVSDPVLPAVGEERGGGRVIGSALLRLQHVYRERARIGKSIAAAECRNAREQNPAADATELMLLVRGDHLVGVSARDRIVWGRGSCGAASGLSAECWT
jgi:hypothetical protein